MSTKKTKGKLTRRSALKLGAVAATGLLAPHIVTRAAEPAVMKLGTDVPLDHPYNVSFEAWKNMLEAHTEGRVTATLYPDAQLGGEEDMVNGLKIGSVDGCYSSPGIMTPYVPEVGVCDLPFIFRDVDHTIRATNGPIAERYEAKVENAIGAEIVGWRALGSRDMWNNTRPIRTPDDVVGLKMRTQTSRMQQATYLALGALPTPLPFVEIYTAIQTGVVDGADVGISDITAMKFYEVAKYLSLTGHVFIAVPLNVSRKFLSTLSSKDQDAVLESGTKVLDVMQSAQKEQYEQGLEFVANAGMEVIRDVDRAAFAEKTDAVIQENAGQLGGLELVEAIRAA